MALSVFDEKSRKPQAGDLDKTLKRTSAHWDNLIAHIVGIVLGEKAVKMAN